MSYLPPKRNGKNHFAFLSLIILCISEVRVNAGEVSPSRTSECKKVVFSTHPNYPPFHWSQDNTLIGASVAITGQILDELDIPWEVMYEGPWKRVLHQSKAGYIDIIPALKYTPERAEFLSYTTTPFFANPVAIYRLKGSSAIKALSELNHLIGSINAGDKHGDVIDNYVLSSESVVQITGLAHNFSMLEKKRIDFFIIGKNTATHYLKSEALEDKFDIVYESQGAVVHVGFSKQSNCLSLLPSFDQKLKEKYDNGEIGTMVKYYQELWLELQRTSQ